MAANNPYRNSQSVDFFISYTGSDGGWAKWVAWELNRAGYSYRLQAEHFPPGSRFLNEMRTWLDNSDHVLALMSESYFQSQFASLEINAAVVEDPLGAARRVIPVRIQECRLPMLFKDLVFIDFVGKSEDEQRRALVAGLRAALVGSDDKTREVKERPVWPGSANKTEKSKSTALALSEDNALPLRVQFIACDVDRGLDFKGQFAKIQAAIAGGRFEKQIDLHAEFDVTDANLFAKLNSYKPHVVHFAGSQNGGDVLFPSHDGGEVVVPDEALAGLLSSLGRDLRLAIVDTCKSYRCASRVAEGVEFTIGVENDIFDHEAIRFYEIFYQAIGAGHSIADAHGQATAALRFMNIPSTRIPKLCAKPGHSATQSFLVGPG